MERKKKKLEIGKLARDFRSWDSTQRHQKRNGWKGTAYWLFSLNQTLDHVLELDRTARLTYALTAWQCWPNIKIWIYTEFSDILQHIRRTLMRHRHPSAPNQIASPSQARCSVVSSRVSRMTHVTIYSKTGRGSLHLKGFGLSHKTSESLVYWLVVHRYLATLPSRQMHRNQSITTDWMFIVLVTERSIENRSYGCTTRQLSMAVVRYASQPTNYDQISLERLRLFVVGGDGLRIVGIANSGADCILAALQKRSSKILPSEDSLSWSVARYADYRRRDWSACRRLALGHHNEIVVHWRIVNSAGLQILFPKPW